MSTRKLLANWYKLDPQRDLTYNQAKSGSVRIGNTVLPMAWEPSELDSGWWRRGTEGQYAGFAIPIPKETLKNIALVRSKRTTQGAI